MVGAPPIYHGGDLMLVIARTAWTAQKDHEPSSP